MKMLCSLLLLVPLLGCQTKEIGSSNRVRSTHHLEISEERKIGIVPNDRLEKIAERQSSFSLSVPEFVPSEVMLIAHSRFAFIEYIDVNLESMNGLQEAKHIYPGESSIFNTFLIKDKKLNGRYKSFKGKKVQVNNHDRKQYQAKIIDFVVVHDMWDDSPYVAAVLDVPLDENINYAWTNNIGETSYPFGSLGKNYGPDIDNAIIQIFENTTEYGRFEERYSKRGEEVKLEITTEGFEHFSGQKYHVVQYCVLGMCNGMVDNLTAVYLESGTTYVPIALMHFDYFFLDLIDVNQDGFPEILSSDFAASAIFSIEDGKFVELQGMNWSSSGCPC